MGRQGHLVVPRSWGGVWVYSQGSRKLLGIDQWNGLSLLKEEKEKEKNNYGCCVKN